MAGGVTRAAAVLAAACAIAGCGAADADPRAMTCGRLVHDARARMLFVDAIDNRLHARSMAPLHGLPTPRDISAYLNGRCAAADPGDRPYRDALDALGS
jgi:hypothetical protein